MGCWRKASRRWLEGCAPLLALVFASLVVIGVPQVAASPGTQSAGAAFAHADANSVVAAGSPRVESKGPAIARFISDVQRGESAQLTATAVAADTAAPAVEDTTAVIGRLPDTAVAKSWPGHEVLDLPDWSIAKNDQWVQSVIDRKMPVYVGSNPTWENIWDATNARTTVFGRELQQFTNAGYTLVGWTMLSPGGG